MGARRPVVATVPVAPRVLRETVRDRAGENAEVRVVAPADENEARGKAEGVARDAAGAVEPDAARTEAEVGDPDPVQAIEDALRTFPAEEIVVMTWSGQDASWLEQDSAQEARERFGVPVTHLVVDEG